VRLFPWQKKEFLSDEEKTQMVQAVQKAEMRTSGEVRVFIESKCRYMDAVDRAAEIFYKLKMVETKDRNATIVYVAVKDRQAAVFGDEGIHKAVGEQYWADVVQKMIHSIKEKGMTAGIVQAIYELGEALATYFPYDKGTDKNELPDDIVFGR
jgi:uncharacterized membrane protein